MEEEEDVEEDESIIRHVLLIIAWWPPSSRLARSRQPTSSFGSGGDAHSVVVAGDEAAELTLSRFLMVEFQKFLISLSVRPGSLAAI